MPRVNEPLSTEFALLGFLRRQPMYGYEIHQQLSDPTGLGLVWHMKQSQLYALLTKLEREGLVTTTIEYQEARPPRKMFELSGAGRQTFEDWVQQPVAQGRKLRLDFMAKLYFARLEGPQVVARLIERQRLACRDWLCELEEETESLRYNQPYDWLVHKFDTAGEFILAAPGRSMTGRFRQPGRGAAPSATGREQFPGISCQVATSRVRFATNEKVAQ